MTSEITQEMRDAARRALAAYEASKGTQVVEGEEEEPYCDHCQSHVEDYREGDLMCQSCYDELHIPCDRCGEQVWQDDAQEGLCESCYDDLCQELDTLLEDVKGAGNVMKAIRALKRLR